MEKTDRPNNDDKPSQVYVLHFKSPYWTNCKHYVGYTTIGTDNRIDMHRKGKGSLLVNYAHNLKGIPFEVGMVIDCDNRLEGRALERRFKREGHLSRHCEICQKGEAND